MWLMFTEYRYISWTLLCIFERPVGSRPWRTGAGAKSHRAPTLLDRNDLVDGRVARLFSYTFASRRVAGYDRREMSEWLTLFILFFFLEGKEPNSAASRDREESVAAAKVAGRRVAGRGCDASHSEAFEALSGKKMKMEGEMQAEEIKGYDVQAEAKLIKSTRKKKKKRTK